jgi:erythritol kinase (D-erythritol 1-phosphate-forming)
MDDKILAKPAGQILYHPYISAAGERGPFMDPNARAMFTGLEIGHGYADLMRSIFEGLSYAARDCYSAMGDIPNEIRVTGGAARSKALRIILASTLNANVRSISREEAGAAGAAMMAAVQQKIYPDMSACATQWVDTLLGSNTTPGAGLAKTYDQTFPLYKKTRETMQPVWRGLVSNRSEVKDAT